MKKNLVSLLAKIITIPVNVLGKTKIGRMLLGIIAESARCRSQSVAHMGLVLRFAVPNQLTQYRADSFESKEPETLEWIDSMTEGSVVWDIGANVGLYSCYAAKQRLCKVIAFEPSVFNLELLARNIYYNGLTQQITIVPLPLSDSMATSMLNMTSMEWGGAMSTFDKIFGHDGETMVNIFEFQTIGISMDNAVDFLGIPQPDYIKMDVDGIEHLILKGGMQVLAKTKSVLIEINDQFSTQAVDARQCLMQAGFYLDQKRHADCFDNCTTAAKYTYNQIWSK